MEHRWHQRKAVALDMVAQCGTLGSIRGITRNISYGGMLFECERATLAPYTVVKLCCCLMVEGRCYPYSVRAQVIYTDKGRAGLMFLDHEAAYEKLRTALKSVIDSPYSKGACHTESPQPCTECGCGCEEIDTAPSNRAAG